MNNGFDFQTLVKLKKLFYLLNEKEMVQVIGQTAFKLDKHSPKELAKVFWLLLQNPTKQPDLIARLNGALRARGLKVFSTHDDK